MVLKLILKFVVIFSLINSIQCVCQGSQAIIDAISTELNKRTDGLERHVNAILMCVVTGRDCEEVRDKGASISGVYTINPDDGEPFKAYCDMETDGGGWTVFQRRQDGSVDFYRNWDDYVEGFGELNGEFWPGLEKIHCLTINGSASKLRVDLEDFEGEKRYAKYNLFQVLDSAKCKYQAWPGGYNGNAGHALAGQPFTTKDRDNDRHVDGNCAILSKGAWWYNDCDDTANLNGQYLRGNHSSYADGVNWPSFHGHHYSLAKSEMKLCRNFHSI